MTPHHPQMTLFDVSQVRVSSFTDFSAIDDDPSISPHVHRGTAPEFLAHFEPTNSMCDLYECLIGFVMVEKLSPNCVALRQNKIEESPFDFIKWRSLWQIVYQ